MKWLETRVWPWHYHSGEFTGWFNLSFNGEGGLSLVLFGRLFFTSNISDPR